MMKPCFFSVPTFTFFQKIVLPLDLLKMDQLNPPKSIPRMLQPCHQLPSCVGRVPVSWGWKVHEDVRLEVRLKFYKSPNFWGYKCLLILEVVHDHFHLKSRIWIWYFFRSSCLSGKDSGCSKLSKLQLNRVAACCSDQWYPRQIQILKTDKIQPLIN